MSLDGIRMRNRVALILNMKCHPQCVLISLSASQAGLGCHGDGQISWLDSRTIELLCFCSEDLVALGSLSDLSGIRSWRSWFLRYVVNAMVRLEDGLGEGQPRVWTDNWRKTQCLYSDRKYVLYGHVSFFYNVMIFFIILDVSQFVTTVSRHTEALVEGRSFHLESEYDWITTRECLGGGDILWPGAKFRAFFSTCLNPALLRSIVNPPPPFTQTQGWHRRVNLRCLVLQNTQWHGTQ